MKVTQAIKHALNGESILFLGSGFSLGASNLSDTEFSTGGKLAKELCDELNIDEPIDLDIASGIYIEKNGTEKLIDLLLQKYTVKRVSRAQTSCAKIPWKRVYTTNYDTVFETAAKEIGTKYIPVELSSNVKAHLEKRNICLHINGHIDNLNRNTLNDSFKLTTKSYLTDYFTRSKWCSVFKQDVNLAKSVIFIGYSMYDLDIARVIGSVSDIKSKCIFITGDNPNLAESHVIRQIGKLEPGGLDKFIRKVDDIAQTHDKLNREFVTKSFTEYKISDSESSPEDRDRYDLLLRGDLKRNLLFKSLFSSERKYVVPRKQVEVFFDKFEDGCNNFLIHGSLGNGKTITVEQICCRAIRTGWRVFILNEYDRYAIEDLTAILRLEGKVLLVIENYSRHLDFVDQLLMRQSSNVIKLLTERTSINEYYYESVLSSLSNESMTVLDCNIMNDDEIEETISLLDSTALWSGNKEVGLELKKKHVSRHLNGEFQGILLEILKSPDIRNRLTASFDGLTPDSDTYKILILSLILRALGYSATMFVISELLEIDNPLELVMAKKMGLSEVFSVNGSSFEVRSSVLSSFLLTNMMPGSFIADVMTTAYKKCDALQDIDTTYKNMQRELRRYSVIQTLLPDQQRRNLLLNYYEEIKNLESSRSNPFFWVQYGIARLTYRDFEIAEQCFSRAYSIGENFLNFDGYQIDNHFARLLLEKSIYEPASGNPIELFREAHLLLAKQIGNASQNKHYPYRVASLYRDFLDIHEDNLQPDDLSYIKRAARKLHSTAIKLPQELRDNKYVKRCIVIMESIKA
ncbi:SIR2 family protein [Planctobacterium marinum]|uniref:Novel STAND NTPase 5 domain-containing protein n=1 Tax=Planctobacterium marinum TaxID=1631968 RepID=A0AA48HGG2_9ALTE|nr:hypothetical protein MACH26_20090 [Planctobacterium marinum]